MATKKSKDQDVSVKSEPKVKKAEPKVKKAEPKVKKAEFMETGVNKTLVAAVLTKQTEAFNAQLEPTPKAKGVELTKEESEIRRSYLSMSSCGGERDEYMREMIAKYEKKGKILRSAVFEKDDTSSRSVRHMVGAVVKLVRNPNAHNYELHRPLMVVGSNYAYDQKRRGEGNHLPAEVEAYVPVTKDEIAVYVDAIADSAERCSFTGNFTWIKDKSASAAHVKQICKTLPEA